MRYTPEHLDELCRIKQEESLTLEFKSCNELRAGASRHGRPHPQSQDEINMELSKDVSSFLNSNGGTIIYGIREKKSRAEGLDRDQSFKPGEKQTSEWLTHLIRAHISPSPSLVDVYSIAFDDQSWFLVVDILQGQEAYQARDKRFYKRVANITTMMEQYEIADVMRRSQVASLEMRLSTIGRIGPPRPGNTQATVGLTVAIRSTNYISSEFGAFKLFLVPPLELERGPTSGLFWNADNDTSARLMISGQEIRCESFKTRWGSNYGTIVYPGDWLNFSNHPLTLGLRAVKWTEEETYFFKAELFTVNAAPRSQYYFLKKGVPLHAIVGLPGSAPEVNLEQVAEETFERTLIAHLAKTR